MDRYKDASLKLADNRLALIGILCLAASLLFSSIIVCILLPDAFLVDEPLPQNAWRRNISESQTDRRREVYFFNWSNVEEYLNGQDVLPAFEEIGPFSFKETWNLTNVSTSEEGVQYQRSRWQFVQEGSRSLDTQITNINVFLAVIIQRDRDTTSPLMKRVFDYALQNKTTFYSTQSVGELLLGYADRRIPRVADFTFPFVKFGYFMNQNGSVDGLWNFTKYDKLTSWQNGNISVHFNSTAGYFNEGEPLVTFHPDLCNKVTLLPYIRSHDYALDVVRFGVGNGSQYLQTPEELKGECLKNQPPFTMSLPHFEGRTPPNISGLYPETIDWPTAEVETVTGLVLKSRYTFQFNTVVKPIPWSETYLKNITDLEIPLMWYLEEAMVSREVRNVLEDYYKRNALFTVELLLICTGSILSLLGIALLAIRYTVKGQQRNERLINDDS